MLKRRSTVVISEPSTSKKVKLDNKKALTETQYLREKVKRLELQLRQKDVYLENQAKLKVSAIQYKARRDREIEALKKEKERWKVATDYRKDVQQYNRTLDPCRSVCGWSIPSLDVLKKKMKEAKQFCKESPEWDFNILPNAPASRSEIYVPKLLPGDHEGRLFHWGMKDVFAINIYGKKTQDTVYRCTPLPKRYLRLRPRMVTYGHYSMNENDALSMRIPRRRRNWFSRAYLA
ncbi:unnamed protein product [Bursaphelenchus xylophilus]|uniref:(pine wood nematode) hypothetical protein n=1 Tax=Bursaphelenchus xylophilus TaxID=6326 RepID=A0A1I7SMS9_BURXY|nr:unnamed protein product [Bursaphelenchus xylophilus]CAG9130353.1 unnamed protein product [Bursaphelenchus xylophilus]